MTIKGDFTMSDRDNGTNFELYPASCEIRAQRTLTTHGKPVKLLQQVLGLPHPHVT